MHGERNSQAMRGPLFLVAILACSTAVVAAPASWSQTWVAEGARLDGVDTGASTNDCLTTVILSGNDVGGYTLRMRTSTPPNQPAIACEDATTSINIWPMWWEEVHELSPADGDARTGFVHDATVPASCATGFYHYHIELGPLGTATPFSLVYEGECNGHAFHHIREGTVDFVAMATAPITI
jgi:hypothetical protein